MATASIPRPGKPIVVEDVPTFRGIQTPQEIYVIPEIYHKRKMTDVAYLIAFGLCSVILLSVMVYALCNSDIRRFRNGYDDCGNICGVKNSPVDGISCSGQDMTDKPYFDGYECLSSCPNSIDSCDGYYHNSGFSSGLLKDTEKDSTNLIILCFIGLGLSIVALLLFRYFVRQFVWTMLIGSVLLLFALTGFIWYLYSATSSEVDGSSFLYLGIIMTVVSIIFAICLLVLIPRIKLIICFFEEAARIVFAMPLLLLEPVLTFISNFIVMALFIYTFILMSSAGTLQPVENSYGRYDYIPNGGVTFALCWSVIMMLWMLQFILACQHMVISGAVSAYYFARDKLALVSPIYNSFYTLVRYHLGTAAFGSLIITLITILKVTLQAMSRENGWMRLFYYCFKPLLDFLKYMTSMGYIETAIHGQPLCKSSVRAVNLVVSNLLSALVMNSIGNYVFFMAKLTVVAVSVGIGAALTNSATVLVFGGFVALMCVHCFFVVFEIAVDTVFLCYCEDQCMNDGDTRHYYATVELHNHIRQVQALTVELEKAKQKKK